MSGGLNCNHRNRQAQPAPRYPPISDVVFGHHWGVVGRPLVGAWPLVDAAAGAGLAQRCARKDMINAQTVVAPKALHAVVPPGKTLVRLLEQPERVA